MSCSGSVSHAKTIQGTLHLPAWAKIFVAKLSEMPATNLAIEFDVAGATTKVW